MLQSLFLVVVVMLVTQKCLNLANMLCDVSSVKYDNGQCQFLYGADWIVGVETSWYDATEDCGRDATLHSYSKTVVLVRLLLQEMQARLNFSANHRLGVHFADSRYRTVKPLCAHQYSRPLPIVSLPTITELQMDSYENEAHILTLVKNINDEVTRCPRLRPDAPIFIFRKRV
uniref:Uncharacterized protein n=1 Tax=Romanomermis culicivorax TaxID=13658 RepID=A0A915L2G6_ROMCU